MNRCLFMLAFLVYALVRTNAVSQVHSLKNSSVQLECPHRATSTSQLSWSYSGNYPTSTWTIYTSNTFLNDKPVAYPRFNVTGDFSSGEYNLVINDLKQVDRGYYRCNLLGTSKETIQQLVIVVGPSSVTIQTTSNKLLGTEGQRFQINCSAVGGEPSPDVQILRSGSIVSSSKQMVAFSIPQLQRSDDGQDVICRAGYEQMNSFPLTDSASIYLNLKPLKPTFSERSVSVIEGHSLEIMCTSTGSRPAAVFNWDIGRADITSSSVITSSTPDQSTYTVISRLRFTFTKDLNKKNLTCKAINIAAPIGVPALPITVDVKYPPNVTLDDEQFTEKETPIILTCKADGNPTAYTFYEWTHKSLQGTVIRRLNGTSDGTLTLPNVNQTLLYQDAGNYTCTVGNGIPTTSTRRSGSGLLTINAPPVFALYNSWKQGGEIRKPSNISAYVYSIPTPLTYVWLRGSTQVTGTGYEVSSSETTVTLMFHGSEVMVRGFKVTLTIVDVKESDFTNYKLQVKNSEGKIEQTIVFESSSAPDPPKNLSIIDQTDHSITVQWEAGYDGGHEQTFYVLYRQQGIGMWTTLIGPKGVKGGTNQLHKTQIEGLQHSTKYEIKMFSENMVNKSNETMVQIAVTETKIEGGPNGAVIGGVVGSLLGVVIILIISVVIIKLRKKSDGSGKKKIPRSVSDSDGEDGLKDNILYKSVETGGSKPPEAAPSEYAEIQKRNDVYAEVSKPKKQNNIKDKKQKGKKSPGNRKQKPKSVNNNSAEVSTNQSEYGNIGNLTGGHKNADGLQYADITFINPPKTKPGKAGKPVIHGLEDRTIYCDVDHTKKAPPLPQEGAYELTDISKGKQS